MLVPLVISAVAMMMAYRLHRRVPWGPGIYRFHALLYLLMVALSLGVVGFMRVSQAVDWWIDDATLFLTLLFGASGLVLCIVFVPMVWWCGRRTISRRTRRVTEAIVTIMSVVPYFLLAGVLLFYRE